MNTNEMLENVNSAMSSLRAYGFSFDDNNVVSNVADGITIMFDAISNSFKCFKVLFSNKSEHETLSSLLINNEDLIDSKNRIFIDKKSDSEIKIGRTIAVDNTDYYTMKEELVDFIESSKTDSATIEEYASDSQTSSDLSLDDLFRYNSLYGAVLEV